MASWSVETWHFHSSTPEPQACLVTDVVTNNQPLNYMFGQGPYSTAMSFGFYAAAAPYFFYTPSYSLTAGLWYHLLGTYDGGS